MKTDELLYELFKLDPKSVFRLAQLDLEGEYSFESITVKTVEKRIDGFLRRTDGVGPNVFVEFQGWDDQKIYWRSFREVCMFYEERDESAPFILIIVFIDPKIIELLEFAIWQRLPSLSLKEVQKMIQLTPLEETVAGKELIQMGIQRGRQEGRQVGKIELVDSLPFTTDNSASAPQ